LILVDDQGSREVALRAYAGWVDTADLLIGPYGSGLVRAVAPLVRDAGRVLWNHGGSADDLAQPGVASLPAPASSYFDGVVEEAADRRVSRLLVVRAPGPFARAVADGARARASQRGIDGQVVEASAVEARDVAGMAVLVAGPFEHDAAWRAGSIHEALDVPLNKGDTLVLNCARLSSKTARFLDAVRDGGLRIGGQACNRKEAHISWSNLRYFRAERHAGYQGTPQFRMAQSHLQVSRTHYLGVRRHAKYVIGNDLPFVPLVGEHDAAIQSVELP
jgi:hypothetical protein